MELAPIVTDENRLAWLEYSVANKGWLTEGREYQADKGLGSSVGGDPVINKEMLTSNEAGVAYVDPGVRNEAREKRYGS